ncbi:hypothetical protein D3C85_1215100 [compost metagenome]
MFGHENPGAGYLPAHCRALQDAQQQENDRGEIADLGIRGHDPDQQAGQGHHQDAEAEYALAAKMIGKMRHQDPTQRARQVTGNEYSEALQQAQPFRHLWREKQLAQGQRKEDKYDEVIDLQCPAQCRKT